MVESMEHHARENGKLAWEYYEENQSLITRIAALEAQLAEVRRKLQERADWHRCSCPHPCDDYNVFPGGCSGKYRQDYQSILSALEATPPAPKVTVKPLDNDYPISGVASWLANQATRDYTDHEVDALKLAARILAALTAAPESGQ